MYQSSPARLMLVCYRFSISNSRREQTVMPFSKEKSLPQSPPS